MENDRSAWRFYLQLLREVFFNFLACLCVSHVIGMWALILLAVAIACETSRPIWNALIFLSSPIVLVTVFMTCTFIAFLAMPVCLFCFRNKDLYNVYSLLTTVGLIVVTLTALFNIEYAIISVAFASIVTAVLIWQFDWYSLCPSKDVFVLKEIVSENN